MYDRSTGVKHQNWPVSVIYTGRRNDTSATHILENFRVPVVRQAVLLQLLDDCSILKNKLHGAECLARQKRL
jgi:hypothetical protein